MSNQSFASFIMVLNHNRSFCELLSADKVVSMAMHGISRNTHVAATMRENLGFVLKDNDCEATQTGELNPK